MYIHVSKYLSICIYIYSSVSLEQKATPKPETDPANPEPNRNQSETNPYP